MTDALIIGGTLVTAAGLALFDWRLAVIWAGVLLLAVGLVRLRRTHELR